MYAIKTLRLRKGLSQARLAKLLGVHQTAVSQWEKGLTHPAAAVLPRLLKALDCKFEELYAPEDNNPASTHNTITER